jgi:hypothetical protein
MPQTDDKSNADQNNKASREGLANQNVTRPAPIDEKEELSPSKPGGLENLNVTQPAPINPERQRN